MTSAFILLVEDNASDIALTRRALEKQRIQNELVVASDGQEALDFLFGSGQHAGRNTDVLPAVVLLDVNLPRLSGLSVLKEIRAHEKTKLLPVIMLTTSKEEQDLISSYSLGANSYIRKPVDFLQFVEAIGQLSLYWLVLNEPAPTTQIRELLKIALRQAQCERYYNKNKYLPVRVEPVETRTGNF